MNLKTMSDKELIETAKSCYGAIYIIDCYGINDLVMYDCAIKELVARGYIVRETNELVVKV